jgi:hypothetical protein
MVSLPTLERLPEIPLVTWYDGVAGSTRTAAPEAGAGAPAAAGDAAGGAEAGAVEGVSLAQAPARRAKATGAKTRANGLWPGIMGSLRVTADMNTIGVRRNGGVSTRLTGR